MKQISQKQAKKNRILHEIKKLLPKRCHFCGMKGDDLMHTIPKSIFPEYYCEEWNLIIGCRSCHNEYDGCREYRHKQLDLFHKVMDNVKEEDKGRVMKYFGHL